MGLDLCNTLEKEQSAVGLFPQMEEEEAWEDRELAAISTFCPALVAVTLQLHHLAAASCAPECLDQLQPSRKAAEGAADEEGKGERPMPWVRLPGKKQGLLDTQDLSPHHWGSQIAGILPHSGVPSTAVNDVQCSKANIQALCSPYSSAFHACTLWAPIYFSLPFSAVYFAHPLMPTPPNSQASSGWLVNERHFLAAAVLVGRCARRGMQQASCRFFVFWQTSLEDFVLTWARRGTGRCCASFPRSAGSASPIWPATTAPPQPLLPSPLPAQASIYLEQRVLSVCQIAWWFSDVNRWD